MHKYDHTCSCQECSGYERKLEAMVQADRASDRAKEVRVYKERIRDTTKGNRQV